MKRTRREWSQMLLGMATALLLYAAYTFFTRGPQPQPLWIFLTLGLVTLGAALYLRTRPDWERPDWDDKSGKN